MMKTAVVTGACSGIGREFVRQIAGKYSWLDEIWIIARRAKELEKLKEEVREVPIRPLSLDISKEEELEKLKDLEAQGIEITVQPIPEIAALSFDAVKKKM